MATTAVAAPAPEPTPPGSGAGLPPALDAGPTGGLPGFDFSSLLPERAAQDILSGQIRLRLGGAVYVLPVLSIAANRRWKAGLEGSLQGLLGVLDRAGDDLGSVLVAFSTATPQLTDALYSYDEAVDAKGERVHPSVLPAREDLEEVATDAEVLMATLEVWSAANPFAAVALGAMRAAEAAPLPHLTPAAPMNGSSTPTNSARPSTAGRRRGSRRS